MDVKPERESSASDEEVWYSAQNDSDSEQEHICDLCNERFGGKELMDCHRMWHQLQDLKQERKKIGEEVQDKLRNSQIPFTDLTKKKKRLLQCGFCSKKCRSQRVLEYHLREHTGNAKRTLQIPAKFMD